MQILINAKAFPFFEQLDKPLEYIDIVVFQIPIFG